jgi:hypothetical protein
LKNLKPDWDLLTRLQQKDIPELEKNIAETRNQQQTMELTISKVT